MPTPPYRSFDRNTWRKLIDPALRVVDSLVDAGYGKLDFRLGGGTVLVFRFDHRISKDIDIFTYDAKALAYLSPRLNGVAERESPLGYEEQANAVKLLLPDGDVDFIVAAPVIPDAPCGRMAICGRDVVLDATSEILAKKLLYGPTASRRGMHSTCPSPSRSTSQRPSPRWRPRREPAPRCCAGSPRWRRYPRRAFSAIS